MLIELSSRCNSNCKYCFRDCNRNEDMSFFEFKYILDAVQNIGKPDLYLSGQGESLLNPDVWKCLAYAKSMNRSTMLASNSKVIIKENVIMFTTLVNHIQISLDTLDPDKSLELRGIKSTDVIDKIAMIKSAMNRFNTLQVNMLVSEDTFEDLPQMIEYTKAQGVNMTVELPSVHRCTTDPKWKDEWKVQEKMIRKLPEIYEIIGNNRHVVYIEPGMSFKRCLSRWDDVCVTAGGYLIPCIERLNPCEYNLGNVYTIQDLKKLFLGRRYAKFREDPDEYMKVCEPCMLQDRLMSDLRGSSQMR